MEETQSQGKAQFASYPSLRGRAVLVTGGATGIGESIVSHFARQGAQVAFLDIQNEAGHALAGALEAEGCPAPLYLHCDVTNVEALQAAVQDVLGALGTVDVLVNNAANDQRHACEDVTQEYWDDSMAVNLRPQFFMIQAVAPAMKAAGRASIINMSSIAWMIPVRGCRYIRGEGGDRGADAHNGARVGNGEYPRERGAARGDCH